MKPASRGFTLVELLVVVAIIGIIAAVAVPALHNALERGRQKRSMAEIRAVALAVMVYGTDNMFCPRQGAGTVNGIMPVLYPTYLRRWTTYDGWGRGLLYEAEGQDYTIKSLGSDGIAQATIVFGTTTNFAADIVYANGSYVQWPEGSQNH